ncbi:hypothetical protein EJ06DRAFT_585299 [Trichodelitschia bisporula]|uniref:Cupin type-2 domain-containing protein n=1 Tax=Trichodelitschia bisporula TaxID=703511 RepID=A0A6G1HKY8_9PEZI|nr:hypothetical protein EJ06DRAFT_585299 [Trichodelitschia bisporula]
MLSFLARHPPRTEVAHLTHVSLDEGRASITFHPRSSAYLVTERIPPQASDEDVRSGRAPTKANSALDPPLHWHAHQDETFHVVRGTARFFVEGKASYATAGAQVTVPERAYHSFRNASEENELVIEFVLEPRFQERDESFFRNLQTYRDDCRKAGIPFALPQVLLFLYYADTLLALPGPRFIARPLAFLINFLGGLVLGHYILGYQNCYPEYFQPGKVAEEVKERDFAEVKKLELREEGQGGSPKGGKEGGKEGRPVRRTRGSREVSYRD